MRFSISFVRAAAFAACALSVSVLVAGCSKDQGAAIPAAKTDSLGVQSATIPVSDNSKGGVDGSAKPNGSTGVMPTGPITGVDVFGNPADSMSMVGPYKVVGKDGKTEQPLALFRLKPTGIKTFDSTYNWVMGIFNTTLTSGTISNSTFTEMQKRLDALAADKSPELAYCQIERTAIAHTAHDAFIAVYDKGHPMPDVDRIRVMISIIDLIKPITANSPRMDLRGPGSYSDQWNRISTGMSMVINKTVREQSAGKEDGPNGPMGQGGPAQTGGQGHGP